MVTSSESPDPMDSKILCSLCNGFVRRLRRRIACRKLVVACDERFENEGSFWCYFQPAFAACELDSVMKRPKKRLGLESSPYENALNVKRPSIPILNWVYFSCAAAFIYSCTFAHRCHHHCCVYIFFGTDEEDCERKEVKGRVRKDGSLMCGNKS